MNGDAKRTRSEESHPARTGKDEPSSGVTRRQVMVLGVLLFCNLWLAACYSLLAPFFHQEAMKKGVSNTVYGLMFGIYQLVIFLVSPICGALIVVVSPKFMMNTGVFLTGSCSILFGILDGCKTTVSFTVLVFLVRTLEAAGAAAFITASFTFVATEFPNRRATVMSSLEMVYGLGMIIGPSVGGALYQFKGFFLPFASLGAILFLGGVLTFLLMPSIEPNPQEKRGSVTAMLLHPSFLLDIGVFFMIFLLIGFNEATLQPLMSSYKLPMNYTAQGAVFILMGILYAFASPIWGCIVDRMVNPRLVCLLGCILCDLGIMFLGPVQFLPFQGTLWLILVSQSLLGFGLGAKLVAGFVHAIKNTVKRGYPEDVITCGMVSGIIVSVSSIGGFTGPLLGGVILDHFTYRKGSIFILGLEMILTVAMLCYALYEKSSQIARKKNEGEGKLLLSS